MELGAVSLAHVYFIENSIHDFASGERHRPHTQFSAGENAKFGHCVHHFTFTANPRRTEANILGQPRLPSQESEVSEFPNFGVLLYSCLHRVVFVGKVSEGNKTEWP